MRFGSVERMDLKRGVNPRSQVGGCAVEQAGGVWQFVEQGGVFGGRPGGREGVQFALGGRALVLALGELVADAVPVGSGGRAGVGTELL